MNKGVEQLGKLGADALFDQVAVVVEVEVGLGHEHLRLVEDDRPRELERLPQLLLRDAVPPRPVVAPISATGLPAIGEPSGGREAQSTAFFSPPGTPRLYSGVAIRSASASRIASFSATTGSGSPAVSTSPS